MSVTRCTSSGGGGRRPGVRTPDLFRYNPNCALKFLDQFRRNTLKNQFKKQKKPSKRCTNSFLLKVFNTTLTLSRRRPLSYRNQSIDLLLKSVDWFLYDNDLRHKRVKKDTRGRIRICWITGSRLNGELRWVECYRLWRHIWRVEVSW